MQFAAAIFDLDGTIIKDEEVWGKVYATILKSLGAVVTETTSHDFGVSVADNFKHKLAEFNIKTGKTIDELVALAFIEVQKLIPEMALNDGVVEFMETLQENGTPLALATSSNWETTEKVLNHFDLLNFFESITTIEEIVSPKPAPDIYILASEKLGVDPNDCLVFEDSPAGVTAGKEAGMKVVAVNDSEELQDKLEDADLIVDSFTEISLKAIDAIAQG